MNAGRRSGAGAQRRAPPSRRVDGVLLLDKGLGQSSNHAVLAVRRLFGAAKAGHGGTLDPMASGLLPVLLGEATKFAHDLLDADKTYVATLMLGETSTTADAEGDIRPTQRPLPDRAAFSRVLQQFTGQIDQLPPMYSALKRDGRPLYEYARQGIELERQTRAITIHRIELLSFEPPQASIRVACSKGTYLRTLAEDIGEACGCGAWLRGLRREAVGALELDRAVTLAAIEAREGAARDDLLEPPDLLLASLGRVELDAEQAVRFGHGQRLRVASPAEGAAERVGVYCERRLLGVASLENGVITPVRLVAMAAESDSAEGVWSQKTFQDGNAGAQTLQAAQTSPEESSR